MTFKAITWNILANAYIKPKRYPYVPPEALERSFRRQLLLKSLVAQNADLYLLQEVEPDAFEAIAESLGSSFQGHFAQKLGKPEGSAIFVKRNTFNIHRTETLTFQAQETKGTHLALLAHLQAGQHQLAVACTHLKWEPPGTHPDRHIGYLQMMELLDYRATFAPTECPWIVGGDFNAISQSPVVEDALTKGLLLSCRKQRPWDTCNINRKRRKLDYLLYTPDVLTPYPGQLPRLDHRTPMPSMELPSDHLPVDVDFEWKHADEPR